MFFKKNPKKIKFDRLLDDFKNKEEVFDIIKGNKRNFIKKLFYKKTVYFANPVLNFVFFGTFLNDQEKNLPIEAPSLSMSLLENLEKIKEVDSVPFLLIETYFSSAEHLLIFDKYHERFMLTTVNIWSHIRDLKESKNEQDFYHICSQINNKTINDFLIHKDCLTFLYDLQSLGKYRELCLTRSTYKTLKNKMKELKNLNKTINFFFEKLFLKSLKNDLKNLYKYKKIKYKIRSEFYRV